LNSKCSSKRRLYTNKDVVLKYFELIERKNINSLVNLFAEDSVAYEQLSKVEGGLRGKSAIEPFLRVSMVANDGLKHEIKFEKPQSQPNTDIANNDRVINAVVTFQKGDKVKARFTFEFDDSDEIIDSHQREIRRIKTLSIRFLP
jgi:hypothetical protein